MNCICCAWLARGSPSGAALFKPLRQTIESINETFKGQLDLERHGGRTRAGVIIRVLIRILALTSVVGHNDTALLIVLIDEDLMDRRSSIRPAFHHSTSPNG
nr:hypothetical protein [Nonomuraea typhae]